VKARLGPKAQKFLDRQNESKRLIALKPLLADLAEYDYVLETDLTEEESLLLAEGIKEYEKNPASFITIEEYKKSRNIA